MRVQSTGGDTEVNVMNRKTLRGTILSRPLKRRQPVDRRSQAQNASVRPTDRDRPAPVQHLQQHWPWWVTLLVALVMNYLFISVFFPGQPQRVDVSYTFFKQQVEAENVAEISTRADTIQGTFRQGAAYPPDAGTAAKTVRDFSTVLPVFADPGLETLLNA